MKNLFTALTLTWIVMVNATAQEVKEIVQPLSAKAIKGFLYDTKIDNDGSLHVTYKMKVKKSKDEVTYEEYEFDKALNFKGTKDAKENKVEKEDYERTYYFANVGGTTSFDVLSMKLKINKVVQLRSWDFKKQRYYTKKTLSRDVIKPKNDNGKVYYGYASYSVEEKPDIFTIVKYDTKDKKQPEKFCILLFNKNLETVEKPISLEGNYSLVYCDQLSTGDVVMLFAPKKGSADVSKYLFFQFDIEGNQKSRIEYSSPASAMLVTSSYDKDGSVYFYGTSGKAKESFEKVYSEYCPIDNPGFSEGGANSLDFKWQKFLYEKMENVHLLKFNANELAFASTTPISSFKSKFIPAEGEKGAKPYTGKRFIISNFFVSPAGEYFAAGQAYSPGEYGDLICFHFDKNGNLKAQYGVNKVNNEKKSEVFRSIQQFYITSGNKICWEILEVKGFKGYETFMDAYNNAPSFYPRYFPRIAIINTESTSVSAFKTMGSGKYFLRSDFLSEHNPVDNSIYYFGQDEDDEKLWIGKVLIP